MNWIRNTFEISHANHKAIISMEGIRGFAVFLVFLVHYVALIEPWLYQDSITFIVANYMRSIGYLGVDLFFVLSGYLIYGMLIKKQIPFGSYIFRRIRRIYPTFTVVFVVYLVLSVLFPGESKIPKDLGEGVIFVVQNYLLMPGLFDVEPIVTVAWSLSYEFFYYLLIPVVITFLGMRLWESGSRILLFLTVTIISFGLFAIYGGHIELLMFVSGILLFETMDNRFIEKLPPIGLPALLLAIFSVIFINVFDMNGWWNYVLLYVLFYIFCLECFLSTGITGRLFSSAPVRWLGNMSYSYYLIHGLALNLLFLLIDKIYPAQNTDIWLFWLLLPFVFFLTLIPSSLLFVYIEKPYSLTRKSV